ncbi:bombyxin F-1 [Bombyx mandarina]|uniref:Bombyxin F-1 n=2 Tax=Bombyx TaxID=7090 RepID=BXF1_BOMMO|nr:bombyxin F-1 precursor [Bombyx mori]XP_028039075.1 bombyxin F-1 [Bombyx mandarina]P91896.2 RecName: Full=Bombyxin F-1; Short=BBX-F1; Contains: RecName: Full=Bombyxin F-1 B chain; Contains: RecName: Full=Bombyxin F-1 A chain; Flags: Precursor [Bombyx mori]BAA19224.1 preprobombyxin F1 [Bombyx mori]
MKLVVIVLLVISVSILVSAQELGGSRRYCGRHLAQTMAVLCWGIDEMSAEKRNSDMVYEDSGMPELLPADTRKKRGIIDECCLQACTRDVLLSYC